ncbi:MAG: insulinase family protein [Sphingomonadales bacterium]|nr:insulinase family protein [Sphingomonadales bacterium]
MTPCPRFRHYALPFLAAAFVAPLTCVPIAYADEAVVAPTVDPDDWLYGTSDIPRDLGWQFGTLENGLRYAVRNNGAPPGQVSIRVRVGAGSLMETDAERGFAHFIEHLTFRGSRYLDDGEMKRVWQRLGVAFGSDTNAATSPTSTVYQLDLPSATPAALEEAMTVVAGMMEAPNLDQATVASERGVVLSELREGAGPQARVADAMREHAFAGQLLAKRLPIGTEASLNAATAGGLAAFHDRWYRPDNIVIAIAGDGDPSTFAALIEKHFGRLKATGDLAPVPDFGDPRSGLPVAKIVYEPTQPALVTLSYLRPWRPVRDSVAYTQSLYHDFLATQIINRRLEERARSGGSYVVAQVGEDKISRSAILTGVTLVPVDDWKKALTDVRGVIADALASPPSQAEIDRVYDEMDVVMTREVENAQNQPGSDLVDDLMDAIDIGETVSDPVHHREMFRSSRPLATPEQMLKTTRKLFSAMVVRAFATLPSAPAADAEQALAELATVAVPGDASARVVDSKVAIDDLPPLGKPGTVVSVEADPALELQKLTLSNGVTALLLDNDVEPDKIRIRVRFGGGRRGLSPTQPNLLWTGPFALAESGIGKFAMRDIEAMTAGRLIGLDFGIDESAYRFEAETNSRDFADQLRLIASKLKNPGWDPAPVRRARAVRLSAYDSSSGSPSAVLDRELYAALRPADARYAEPSRDQIAALTPEGFRAFWSRELASGPIEVIVFGDLSKVDEQAVLAQTFGALAKRKPKPGEAAPVSFPATSATPQVLRHSGDTNQAAAVMVWKTAGGLDNIREARQLDVLAAIFNDRLFDRLRADQGASYSPSVGSDWPRDFASGGLVMAASLVKPQDIGTFYRHARAIARELISAPVAADELDRAVTPIKELIYRASSGNVFFMNELEGATTDPRRVDVLRSYIVDTTSTTPADIQRLAQTYLANDGYSLVVLPEGVTLASVLAANDDREAATAAATAARPVTAAESR